METKITNETKPTKVLGIDERLILMLIGGVIATIIMMIATYFIYNNPQNTNWSATAQCVNIHYGTNITGLMAQNIYQGINVNQLQVEVQSCLTQYR